MSILGQDGPRWLLWPARNVMRVSPSPGAALPSLTLMTLCGSHSHLTLHSSQLTPLLPLLRRDCVEEVSELLPSRLEQLYMCGHLTVTSILVGGYRSCSRLPGCDWVSSTRLPACSTCTVGVQSPTCTIPGWWLYTQHRICADIEIPICVGSSTVHSLQVADKEFSLDVVIN